MERMTGFPKAFGAERVGLQKSFFISQDKGDERDEKKKDEDPCFYPLYPLHPGLKIFSFYFLCSESWRAGGKP